MARRAEPDAAAVPAVPRRKIRWGALTGLVSFLYLVFVAVEVSLAGAAGKAYTRLHQLAGNGVARFVLAAVVPALIFHGLNGLRIVVQESVPSAAARERRLRFAVQFLTFAMAVPLAFVIVWPTVSEWFA